MFGRGERLRWIIRFVLDFQNWEIIFISVSADMISYFIGRESYIMLVKVADLLARGGIFFVGLYTLQHW